MPRSLSILIVNPNSTQAMTDALSPLLADLTSSAPDPPLRLTFHTAPPPAPPSIDDEATSATSASAAFPGVVDIINTGIHDGVLVACYSAHSLVGMLRAHLAEVRQADVPAMLHEPLVLGIFEASLLHARALGRRFGIVTTGAYWEGALSAGANALFGSADAGGAFVGVRSTGLSALELHKMPAAEVHARIALAAGALVGEDGAEVVIMGCAGMSGMEAAVREGARAVCREVIVLDAVRCGVGMLEGILRAIGRV